MTVFKFTKYRLQEDLKTDPWFTFRFRKYTAGPKRIGFKNKKKILTEYRSAFTFWFLTGAALTWPVAAWVGNSFKATTGGVARIPINQWNHKHPNTHPSRTTHKFFRKYSLITMFCGGFALARYMVDDSPLNDQYYTRPDFKPKAAMVNDHEMEYDSVAYQQLL